MDREKILINMKENNSNSQKCIKHFFERLDDNDFTGRNEKEIVDYFVNWLVDEAIPHSWNTSHPMDKCCLDNLDRVLDKNKLSEYIQTKNLPNLKRLMRKDKKKHNTWIVLEKGILFLLIVVLGVLIWGGEKEVSNFLPEQPEIKRDIGFSQSNKILGKRKIVIIAPSLKFADEGFGRIIQDTLKDWLFDMKQNIWR